MTSPVVLLRCGNKVKATQPCPTLCYPMDCRLFCPWNSPGKNTGVGSHSLLQGIFPTQRLNLCLLPCRWIFYLWATGEDPIWQHGSPMLEPWVTSAPSLAPSPWKHDTCYFTSGKLSPGWNYSRHSEFLLDEDSAYLLKAFNPRAQLVQELECCHDSILGMEWFCLMRKFHYNKPGK